LEVLGVKVTDRSSQTYDLKGLKCPLPVLKTRKRLESMQSGDTLVVDTTDPLAVIDITHLCREDGHQLVSTNKTETGHRFEIIKR
jgi:tRNA 2-thiouridine synthesizing protein A